MAPAGGCGLLTVPMSAPPPPPRRARFVAFGCKVNQYESEVFRERAAEAGVVETAVDPEVVVVHTCAVTEHGGAEARKAVRRLAREHPGARIVVTGCYASCDPEAAAALPGVTAVLGNDRRDDVLRLLGAPPPVPFIEQRVGALAGRTRPFVKVQDGCPLSCAFCIIPRLRPEVRSKSAATVVHEVRALAEAGHAEVVLTGVHLGAWGEGGGAGRGELPGLVERVLAETPVRRLRLSSLEVHELSDRLLALLAGSPRIAPHLHLPLQSGSDAVLARMRRRYGAAEFLAAVRRARERLPGCGITTDVLAGFPGETEADFETTLAVMSQAGFSRTHVFPFSPRRGTAAAAMPGRIHPRTVRDRARRAGDLGRLLAAAAARAAAGSAAEVVVEERLRDGRLTGFTGPYLRAYLDDDRGPPGRLLPVRLLAPFRDGLLAERLPA